MNVRGKMEILKNYPKIKERILDMVDATLGIDDPTDGYIAMLSWVELCDNYFKHVIASLSLPLALPWESGQFWAALEACELDLAKDMQPSIFS